MSVNHGGWQRETIQSESVRVTFSYHGWVSSLNYLKINQNRNLIRSLRDGKSRSVVGSDVISSSCCTCPSISFFDGSKLTTKTIAIHLSVSLG